MLNWKCTYSKNETPQGYFTMASQEKPTEDRCCQKLRSILEEAGETIAIIDKVKDEPTPNTVYQMKHYGYKIDSIDEA